MKESKFARSITMMAIALTLAACSSCSKKEPKVEKQAVKIGDEQKEQAKEPFDEKFSRFNTYDEAKEQSSTYFLSSKTCRKCHDGIYDNWKNSMHSMSVTDPVFEASFYKAFRLVKGKATGYCLKCHAPIGSVEADYDLNDEVVREGVTCDFCHSIKAVDLNSKDKFTMGDDDTKMGPLKDAKSQFHKSQYSPLHTQSELCGGCHNLTNENGVEVMGTYTEWKASDYSKKGVQCQNCHMPLLENSTTVNNQVDSPARKANSHLLEGGHSEAQLKKAVSVKVSEVVRKADGMDVKVNITNSGAGHKIPTGAPSRRLALNVVVYSYTDNQEITRQTRIYKKVLLGKSNEALRDDAEMFLFAGSVESDNRLSPGETREESFSFPIGREVGVRVEAELVYEYDPMVFVEKNMRVRMGFDSAASVK